jgi:hypothetical protein
MSRLNNNSTPAERMRGCVFAETFETQAKVVGNGGTISGTPTIDFGVTLDGSSDCITHSNDGRFDFGAGDFTIICKVKTPTSWWQSVAFRCVFDKSSGSAYSNSGDADGAGIAMVNNGKFAAVVDGISTNTALTGGSLQLDTEYTVALVYDSSSGSTLYIDGVAVDTDATISTTNTNAYNAATGCNDNSSSRYLDGLVSYVKVFKGVALTTQEVLDYHNNATYDYMNDTVVDLPMTLETHDPTNNRTLDVSGNGLHGTLGAGDGGVTTPTKNTDRCGYNYDADDDYINLGNNALLRPTDGLTISVWSVDTADANVEIVNYRESGGSGIFALYKVTNAICAIKTSDDVSETASHDAEHQNGVWTHTVLTFSQDDQEVRSYIQGIVQADIEATADLPLATELAGLDNVYIGSATATLRNWGGDIAMFKLWDKRLTPLQIADLHQRELKKINCA